MSRQDGSQTLPRRRRWPVLAVLASAAMLAAGLTPAAAATTTNVPSTPTPCAGNPLFITDTCVDPALNVPYIDADHPGTITDTTTGVTVSFLYVHGGFCKVALVMGACPTAPPGSSNVVAKFSFYFPAPDQYQGRFFEGTYPTLSQEDATPPAPQPSGAVACSPIGTTYCSVAFAISNGAYVVSTDNAGGVPTGGALAPYRANAAAAKFSRTVAEQMVYHTSARPRGYLYGASGGAYQTVGAMENTSGVWDGAVPQVFGTPNAIPSFMTIELLVLRVLGDKLAQVADAVAPGGSGNPYAGLDATQTAVLQEATRLGFPLRGWWQWATLGGGGFLATEFPVRAIDPSYVNDFWTKPGYEGHDDPAVQTARIQSDTSVVSQAGANGLVLANVPAGDLVPADLVVTSGPFMGQSVPIVAVVGNTVVLLANPGITSGTTVRLDNSWLIALQYYQRHQVPTPDEYAWNQYRGANGLPSEPQRHGNCGLASCLLVGPILAGATAGSVANGHFSGKMIMLESAMDVQALPWSADWYRSQAQSFLGASLDDHFRLWYMDNADHDPGGPVGTTAANAAAHIVSYDGEIQQALLDLDAWVAKGIPPPASTNYTVDADTQIQLPATAPQRRGVQPVVTLSANANGSSGQRVDVAVGQPVTFTVDARVPPGTGKIVWVEWDFLGVGNYPVTAQLSHISPVLNNLQASYAFTQPGTYFPVVRVTSQRNGDTNTPYELIMNLARVRVVVH
jgi:hypothetical protein